eukprot:1322764-Amorphochlora_amoeboformis.AAC.2
MVDGARAGDSRTAAATISRVDCLDCVSDHRQPSLLANTRKANSCGFMNFVNLGYILDFMPR